MLSDLRLSLRTLANARGFTLVAVLTLSLNEIEVTVRDPAQSTVASFTTQLPIARAQPGAFANSWAVPAAQPKAKSMLHEIWMAETRADAERAFERFLATYSAKYPKATECLAKDRKSLLAFYDFPAEHWLHIRTTNPIESSFSTIRTVEKL